MGILCRLQYLSYTIFNNERTLMWVQLNLLHYLNLMMYIFVIYSLHMLSFVNSVLQQTVEAWRLIFIITFVIFSIEFLFYVIFGSGDLQEWAKPKAEDKNTGEHRLLEKKESKGA